MNERPSLRGFLRSRRERVTPAEVGLPDGGRRRTAVLRREELAILAGISVDYLVRLEQNRDRRPSAAVLASLCAVLRLNDDERAHLVRLAAFEGQREMRPTVPGGEPLSATIVALLDKLDATPALVVERSVDIAAWNQAFDALMRAAIVGSTREGRFGPTVAAWFVQQLRMRTDMYEVMIDLAHVQLPAVHPAGRDPRDSSPRRWSSLSQEDHGLLLAPVGVGCSRHDT